MDEENSPEIFSNGGTGSGYDGAMGDPLATGIESVGGAGGLTSNADEVIDAVANGGLGLTTEEAAASSTPGFNVRHVIADLNDSMMNADTSFNNNVNNGAGGGGDNNYCSSSSPIQDSRCTPPPRSDLRRRRPPAGASTLATVNGDSSRANGNYSNAGNNSQKSIVRISVSREFVLRNSQCLRCYIVQYQNTLYPQEIQAL